MQLNPIKSVAAFQSSMLNARGLWEILVDCANLTEAKSAQASSICDSATFGMAPWVILQRLNKKTQVNKEKNALIKSTYMHAYM